MKQNIEINVNVSHPAKEERAETVETTFASTKVTGKKTQNGITIYVPMDYYMQMIQMKMETGTPIKDIARRQLSSIWIDTKTDNAGKRKVRFG